MMREYEKILSDLRLKTLLVQSGMADPLYLDAADAIEELLKEVQSRENDCINLTGECATYYAQIPHWISVEERLPEIGRSVLLFNGAVHIGWRVDGKRFRFLSERFPDHPTHWMPLPKAPVPPKEVRDA